MKYKIFYDYLKWYLANWVNRFSTGHAKIFESEVFSKIDEDNLAVVQPTCEHEDWLNPCQDSDDSFDIDYEASDKTTTLRIDSTGETFTDYCLVVNYDLTYRAQVCQPKAKSNVAQE